MWKIVNRELVGRSHISYNIPCQDKTYAFSNNNDMVCALSDGAGSCPLSHLGADTAVKSVSHLLNNEFDNLYYLEESQLKDYIINTILSSIYSEYGSNIDIKNYSGTLLCVAVKNNKVIAASLGDSLLGVVSNRKSELLFLPASGEFKNQTYFFTSSKYQEKMNIFRGELGDIDGFILMSDGTAESLYSRQNNVLAGAVNVMMDWLEEHPIEVVDNAIKDNLEQVFSTKTIDDCSIILAKYIPSTTNTSIILDSRSLFEIKSINIRQSLNQINSLNMILKSLSSPRSLAEIKSKTKLKERKLKRSLNKLESLSIIRKDKGIYYLI